MFIIMITLNIVLSIIVALDIYNFSHSILWSLIGTLILTGSSMQINPIVALIVYPIISFIFNDSLTLYSAIYIGIIILQFIVCVLLTKNDNVLD